MLRGAWDILPKVRRALLAAARRLYSAWVPLVIVGGCGSDAGFEFQPRGSYEKLSEAGLYTDIEAKMLAPDLVEYTVAHVLWSDGAAKRRWIRLPRGTRIDNSDMDHWQLPVGAQVFKEFRRDGVLVETRLIERVDDQGDRIDDFWMGAFLWNEDGTDAEFVVDGAQDVLGTEHDVPSQDDCWKCHRGQPGGILGVGAIQLSHGDPDAADLSTLIDRRMLSHAPSAREFTPPGDPASQDGLGYLYANCGHCHSPLGIARIDTDMLLQLTVDDTAPEDTQIYDTTVNVELQFWTESQSEYTYRVVPGAPDQSGVVGRMLERDEFIAMPPIATEVAHEEGIDVVRDWISAL